MAAILTGNGVEAWRVQTAGVGYNQPVASNDTPGGRAQNRRVEIVITPTGRGPERHFSGNGTSGRCTASSLLPSGSRTKAA